MLPEEGHAPLVRAIGNAIKSRYGGEYQLLGVQASFSGRGILEHYLN